MHMQEKGSSSKEHEKVMLNLNLSSMLRGSSEYCPNPSHGSLMESVTLGNRLLKTAK